MSNTVDINAPITIHGKTAPLKDFIAAGEVVLDKSSTTGYRIVTAAGYPVVE